ncbi:Signal peptidase I [hydrothermal vent metagenome]|uniref:signal peptidase I n=1 Tax=hydrothermal vent metagenome TaxID=652676 RepID=A0A3B0RUE3_9ZZZZ
MNDTKDTDKKTVWDEFVELFLTLGWALVIALFLRTIFFQPFHIPSASMYPQLMIGDYLISSKYSYGYSKYSLPLAPNVFSGRILDKPPKRGDIVVFKWPRDNKTDYIKRVIGLPGDRVQVKNGRLWLNNKQVAFQVMGEEAVTVNNRREVVTLVRETLPNGKSYITWDRGRSPYDNTPVEIIPEGHYFMMGDNRDNSLDSRDWGVVPAQNLVGRGERVLLSVNEEFRLLKPWTWLNFRKRFFVSLRKDR